MPGPILIEQLAMALLGMLISMIVKSSGLAAVVAVNLLNTLVQFFQQIFLSISVTVTAAVSQHRGHGDFEATGKTASQSLTLSLLVSAVLAISCLLFMQPSLHSFWVIPKSWYMITAGSILSIAAFPYRLFSRQRLSETLSVYHADKQHLKRLV